jgi:MoxR-like ATPase
MALSTYLSLGKTKELIKASFRQFQVRGPGGYVPLCLWGEKGIGKTTSVKDAVKELREELSKELGKPVNVKLTILKLGSMQSFTINGYPMINERTIKNPQGLDVASLEILEQKHASPKFLVDSYAVDYHVVFVDEINRARPEMHNAIMGMLDGDGINEHAIPKNTFIVSAANPSSASYTNVTDMDDEALLDRMVHINVATTVDETLSYMQGDKSIDKTIYQYLTQDTANIQKKDGFPTVTKSLIPADRSYANIGRLVPFVRHDRELFEATAKGILGDNDGDSYVSRFGVLENIYTPEDILNGLTKRIKEDLVSMTKPTEAGADRVDVVAKIAHSVTLYLRDERRKDMTKKQMSNLKEFLEITPHSIKETFLTKTFFTDKELPNFREQIIESTDTDSVPLGDLNFR